MHLEEILRCPITHSNLVWLDNVQIGKLNEMISRGSLYYLDGTPVGKKLNHAFASNDKTFIFPIENDIAILLPNLAITTNKDKANEYSGKLDSDRKSIMDFYNQIGWQETDKGICLDAARFEDLRPVTSEYIHKCHMRVRKYFPKRGNYLLDIASGPVQYPEYLTYSSGYEYRICADISFSALEQAKKRLGDRGIYLLCDITNIPLKDNAVDAFISLHTIFHVPAEDQMMAIEELYRVLDEGCSGIIVYSWGSKCLMNAISSSTIKKLLRRLFPAFIANQIFRLMGLSSSSSSPQQTMESQGTKLYFHSHGFAWYRSEIEPRFKSDIASWRSVSVPFLKTFVHKRLFGKILLKFIYSMEETFPHLFGRHGQYPVFIFNKRSLTSRKTV